MKKVILTFSCIALAFAANAQLIIGGNLGFNTQQTHLKQTETLSSVTQTANEHRSQFNFLSQTKIGYQFNDVFSAGVIFGFEQDNAHLKDYEMSVANASHVGTYKISQKSWMVSPYLRCNIAYINDLIFFAEASVPFGGISPEKWSFEYGSGNREEGNNNTETHFCGIQITPGFNYVLTENISLDLYVDIFSIGFTHLKTTHTETAGNWTIEETATNNQFGFGLNTLPSASTTAIRVGVNIDL